MYTVRKLFKFEMAHVLTSSYAKECQNLHGHSYRLEVIISALALNSYGMVIDFKRLKEIVAQEIINKWDHKCVLEEAHYGGGYGTGNPSMVFCAYNPTAENMVKDIYDRLKPIIFAEIPSFVSLKIRLHETDTGYAEYSK